MDKNKVLQIMKFSFYKYFQNKWFVIFNLITLISVIIMINFKTVSSFIPVSEEDKTFTLEVIDNEDLAYSSLNDYFKNNDYFIIKKVLDNNYDEKTIPKNLAVIEIFPDENVGFKTKIISREGIDHDTYEEFYNVLLGQRNNIIKRIYALDDESFNILRSNLDVERVMLGVDNDNGDFKQIVKTFSAALTYLIAVIVFSKVANEISSEKQTKSSEYVLTTVNEKEYLFAKVASNIATLVFQSFLLIVYYLIAGLIGRLLSGSFMSMSLSNEVMDFGIDKDLLTYILALIFYNILNLILMAIIEATLASKTASSNEAGNTVSIMVFIIMVAYIVTEFLFTPTTKVSTFLYVISCLPILSSFFVPAMIVIGQANVIQIIVSIALLLISIPLSFKICAPVFKNGILDYSKFSKSKEEKKLVLSQELKNKRIFKNIGFIVGFSIILYVGIQVLMSILFNVILDTYLGQYLSKIDINLIMQIAVSSLSLGIAYLYVKNLGDNEDKPKSKSLKNGLKYIPVAILIVMIMQVILGIIYPKIGLNYNIVDSYKSINANSSTFTKMMFILAISIVPAVFEELFFRKALIDLTSSKSTKFALLFSSLLFGLIHMNLSQFLFAFIMGLILGYIYLKTRNLKLTIAIHFINNFFGVMEYIGSYNSQETATYTTFYYINLVILAFLMLIGLVILLRYLIKKKNRQNMLKIASCKINLSSMKTKYKYLLYDYTFDISIIMVILLSILTENLLR